MYKEVKMNVEIDKEILVAVYHLLYSNKWSLDHIPVINQVMVAILPHIKDGEPSHEDKDQKKD